MDKIELLIKKLGNKLTQPIVNRLTSLDNLNAKLLEAKKELDENPNDPDLIDAWEQINEYVEEKQDEVIDMLEELVETRHKQILRKAKEKEEEEARKAKEEEDAKKASASSGDGDGNGKDGEEEPKDEKKKSSAGLIGLIVGGVLLIATVGAVNIMNRK